MPYYQDEAVTIYHGDCRDILPKLNIMSDLVVTDPPYGVNYGGKNKFLNSIDKGNRNQTDITGDNLAKEQTQELWLSCFKAIGNKMRKGAAIYCFMPQGGDQMMMMMMMGAGIEPKHELIWLKNNHVRGRTDYSYIHEPILYAWKQGAGHKFYGGFQKSVLQFDRPNVSKLHPTEKPIPLIKRLIVNSSLPGDIVLDPFLGSGTTSVAAKILGRKCVGIEKEANYCKIAAERCRQSTMRLEECLPLAAEQIQLEFTDTNRSVRDERT
jgi:DNA modification methylase